MIEYKLKNPEAPKNEQIVEKTGHTYEFIFSAVPTQLDQLERLQKEAVAQIVLEEVKIKNYIDHYPTIEKLTPEEVNATRMFCESMMVKVASQKKLDQCKELEKELRDELIEIEKQTGVKL